MNFPIFLNKIIFVENNYHASIFDTYNKSYSFVNPYSYHLVRRNKYLYERLDGIMVDGLLMCMFIKILYGISVTRRSFDLTSVAKDLFVRLNITGESIYFVGAKQNEIEKTIDRIKEKYPTINIVGYRNGFFSSEDERNECYAEIVEIMPNFVVVGMGAVLQERFILDLHSCGYQGVSFTCGGYLRQASRKLDYFPAWSEKYNLRAFYRLYKEKGMFKRLYNVLIEFPILFFFDWLVKK